MTPRTPLTAVVIGAGSMGRRHMAAVAQRGDRLLAIADANPAALAAAAAETDLTGEGTFTSADSLFARFHGAHAPDLAIIATTAPGHAPLTLAAARAGVRFILCEKPMAVSLAECDQMLAACAETGARLAINHSLRLMPAFAALYDAVRDPAFGGLTSLTVVAGNFGLAMKGSHYLDVLEWLTGDPIAHITGWLTTPDEPNARGAQFTDPAGSVRAVTAGGARLYLEAGADQGHGERVIAAGRYGQAVLDQRAGTLTVSVREAANHALPMSRYGSPSVDRVVPVARGDVIAATMAMIDHLEAGTAPDPAAARRIIAALVGAVVSSEHGNRAVALSEDGVLPPDRRFNWP
jgi:predicted dehydrogenase